MRSERWCRIKYHQFLHKFHQDAMALAGTVWIFLCPSFSLASVWPRTVAACRSMVFKNYNMRQQNYCKIIADDIWWYLMIPDTWRWYSATFCHILSPAALQRGNGELPVGRPGVQVPPRVGEGYSRDLEERRAGRWVIWMVWMVWVVWMVWDVMFGDIWRYLGRWHGVDHRSTSDVLRQDMMRASEGFCKRFCSVVLGRSLWKIWKYTRPFGWHSWEPSEPA